MPKSKIRPIFLIITLLIVASVLSSTAPAIGVIFSAIFIVVPLAALIKPMNSIGLGNRMVSLIIFWTVGVFGVAFSTNQQAEQDNLAIMKIEDPDAYLQNLRELNTRRWLSELKEMRPEEYLQAQSDVADAREAAVERAKEEEIRKTLEKAAIEEEKRRKGFHCLSVWDGSLAEFRTEVKNMMREPDSFEHVETRVSPVDENGKHLAIMTYRARNGFGGVNVGAASASFNNFDCKYVILSVD